MLTEILPQIKIGQTFYPVYENVFFLCPHGEWAETLKHQEYGRNLHHFVGF